MAGKVEGWAWARPSRLMNLEFNGSFAMWGDLLSALLAALVGGFSGATVAFFLERHQREKEEKDRKISATLRAQLFIASYLENLENLKSQHLNPLKEDPQKDEKLPLIFLSPVHLKLDLDSLSFLVNHKKPQVFHNINRAQRAYFSAIDALEIRNRFLEKLSEQVTSMERALGPIVITETQKGIRKNHADALYQATEKAFNECENSLALLKDTMRELFPKEISLNVKRVEPSPKKTK